MVEKGSIAFMSALYACVEKTLAGVLLLGLLAHAPSLSRQALTQLHGDWTDKALSEVLSEKYGRPVTVKNARMTDWSEISFGALEVRSSGGQRLLRSSHGNLHLKKFDLSKKAVFETEIDLYQVTFFRDYYKDSPTFRPWNRILKKPFHIDELRLGVTQNRERTLVEVLKSDSREVILEGGLVMDASGQMHDALQVSFSPWMMLRALV